MKAVPLRQYLESRIVDGDERLQHHIDMQIEQVKGQHYQVQTALDAADKLELARLANLERQITLQLAALERSIALQLASRDMAIDKAESSSEKRFASVNEFRAQMGDQQNTYLPREVYEAQLKDLTATLTRIQKRQDEQAGQAAGSKSTTAMMLTVAVVVIMAASFFANYVTSH